MEATTVYSGDVGQIWCRSCGGTIFDEGVQLTLDGTPTFRSKDARMNILMKCIHCTAPGTRASPNAKRREERILYHLITKGVVRVGFRVPPEIRGQTPENIILDELTDAHSASARNYVGASVRGIKGLWVSTHLRAGGYVLGHLRTRREPCNCKMV